MTAPQHPVSASGWKILLPGSVIAISGAFVSSYSVWHHVRVRLEGVTDAACNLSERLSCDTVASSSYSEFLGIPLGVWGLGYFLTITSLLFLSSIKKDLYKTGLRIWGALVLTGILVSLGLAAISFFILKSLCPTCLIIYFLCLSQGLLYGLTRHMISLSEGSKPHLLKGLAASAVIPALLAFIYQSTEPYLMSQAEEKISRRQDSQPNTLASTFHEIPVNRSPYSGLGEDFRKGPDHARVTIVEFSDFQCPACMRMSQPLQEIQEEFADKVQIIYKNSPLDQSCNPYMPGPMHAFACQMAIAARCIGQQQGSFWDFHDLLFARQSQVSQDKLKLWMKEFDIEEEDYKKCMKNQSIIDKVRDDINLAQKLGVDSTPTLFINGRRFIGRGPAALRQTIIRILKEP